MKEKIVIKNGFITILCQVLDIILAFLCRKLFIDYVGIELLGVNSTFISLLNTLSLAELGFESAILYSLYKPLSTNNIKIVEDIIYLMKKIYNVIGFIILVGGIILSLFLHQILKGIDVNGEIYLAYYLLLISNVVTYLLAYKRTLLYAHQKAYICSLIGAGCKMLSTILQILLLIIFHQYILYVFVIIIQNISTNIITSRYVDKHYKFNLNKTINKELFNNIIKDVKNIFWGKIAGFIYSSTDNIIISTFVGTIQVGFLSNYTQIFFQIKIMITSMFNSIKPTLGQYISTQNDEEILYKTLKNYSFIRYITALFLLVPGYAVCDDFITAWIGKEYVLTSTITLLIVIDIFIHFVHGALVDYISCLGLFNKDKNISIIGAIINLFVSLILVIDIGVIGVLIGTVISQTFFWIMRSRIIFYSCLSNLKEKMNDYWKDIILYIIMFIILCLLNKYIVNCISYENPLIIFFIGGFISIISICIFVPIIWYKSEQFLYLVWTLKKLIKNKIQKNK